MSYTDPRVWNRDSHKRVAVLVGGSIGTLLGAKLSHTMRYTAMQAIGTATLLVGISSFLD